MGGTVLKHVEMAEMERANAEKKRVAAENERVISEVDAEVERRISKEKRK